MIWRMNNGNPLVGVLHSMPLKVQHGKQSVDSHGYNRPEEWIEIINMVHAGEHGKDNNSNRF